jgi:quercetin 2,3-dioxygenase
MMRSVRRSCDRYETTQPGIRSRHCFSAGPHYDPGNTAFGSLLGVDEHEVGPGAGFGWHPHRGVEIASWVLDGTLRHEDGTGSVELVRPGVLLRQSAAGTIRHRESNASDSQPLRFLQLTWLAGVDAALELVRGAGTSDGRPTHLYVARGSFTVGDERLDEADSLRTDEPTVIDGDGELLIWRASHAR